nr:uncharacterized protein LOC128696833 [Cherax quadricarinatus]
MAWCALVTAAVTSMVMEVAGSMEDTIKDLYEEPPEGQEGRFFLNYDQSTAFNTSVSVTIPIFSFTLPGARDYTTNALSLQSFGALSYIVLFLLGGLALSVFTTTQGGSFSGRSEVNNFYESTLTSLVTESLSLLPSVVDTRSCAKLTICEAYADSDRYSFLTWPIKFLVPSPGRNVPLREITEFEAAARYGDENGEDCQDEYPCLVQPLDLILLIYNYWHRDE